MESSLYVLDILLLFFTFRMLHFKLEKYSQANLAKLFT